LHIAPLLNQKVFPVLQSAWNPIAKKVIDQEEYFDPDAILIRMKTALAQADVAEMIRQKYAAAIIDEFQDTDAVQWEIFRDLFFQGSLRALYLVGDPKQSIYRFRKADVYTYLKARDFLGEDCVYQLDTNFRSSKRLIGALNALFSREWLYLPKIGKTIPYYPVKAGAKIETDFPDEKGALHFLAAEGEPGVLFEQAFLPYAVREIKQLKFKNCALLVKDRFQAERALEFLKKRGIEAVAKSHTPLGETDAFRAISELFDAVLSPHDKNAALIVMAGPFAKRSEILFSEYKILLEERGLVPFAKEFDLDGDAMQIFELLFAWEKKEGFSFDGLKRFLKSLRCLDAEEGGRRRMEVNEEAVQIMTLHISKGLEFEVVFALGLASRTPQGEEIEELDAEKKRQLYVAMTRAKTRLYVPLVLNKKEADPGTHSPMELFSRHFQGSLIDELELIGKSESITLEYLPPQILLNCPVFFKQAEVISTLPQPRPFTPSYLSSFTTLAKPQEIDVNRVESDPTRFTSCAQYNLQTMPRGSDTGVAIHAIFEALFSSTKPIWRDPSAIDALVSENLKFSPLLPWKEAISEMVKQTVSMPLQSDGEFFTLNEIERFQVEMEFIFSSFPNFVKGFIDLVFYHQNKVYFIDWKTNWLEEYSLSSLQNAMEAHDYGLQASLYTEAVQRHFKAEFGGAYYLFVRGGAYFRIGPKKLS
jgi:exodeoxyribonuclease V beta subunit